MGDCVELYMDRKGPAPVTGGTEREQGWSWGNVIQLRERKRKYFS